MTTELTLIERNKQLEDEVVSLKKKITDLENKLQKYTNNDSKKRYYEKNKEIIKQKALEKKKLLKEENPEKIKEYAHTAYLNRKAKLEKEKIENV